MINALQTGDYSVAYLSSIQKLDLGHALYIATKEKYAKDIHVDISDELVFVTAFDSNGSTAFEISGIKSDEYKIVPLKYSYAIFLFDELHKEGEAVEFVVSREAVACN